MSEYSFQELCALKERYDTFYGNRPSIKDSYFYPLLCLSMNLLQDRERGVEQPHKKRTISDYSPPSPSCDDCPACNDLNNEIRILTKQRDDLLAACEDLQWKSYDNLAKARCPSCMNSKENGHRHDCMLQAAIAASEVKAEVKL